MTPYLILPLIEVSFCLALLGLLFSLGRRHVARKPFALFLFFMALWGLFIFLMRFTSDLSQALLWEKFVFASILSASMSFYWFTISFTGNKPHVTTWVPLVLAYVFGIALIPTDLLVEGMKSMWYGKAPIVGHLFIIYVLCVYGPLLIGGIHLTRKFRNSRNNDERTRYQYIMAGLITVFIAGTTDYLASLAISVYPLGVIGNILFCVLTTIAMLRYGLLDIRAVIRKGAAYSLISIFIFGIFGSVVLVVTAAFQKENVPLSLTLTITAVFLIAAIFQPLLARLQRMVDRWFFRQRYDSLQALKRFAQETEGDLDLNQLSASLVTTVNNSMQSGGVYLLLPSPMTGDFITRAFIGQNNRQDFSFSNAGPLAITMKYQDRIVDGNDMDIIPSLGSLTAREKKILAENTIELIMPLKIDSRLVGMLLLSNKVSREPYSNEDRQILQSVSDDIAVRIESASRYESIKQERSELQKTMDGVIYAISAVVESRDPYTAGHQRRVAELARAIAGEMGLSEWQMKGMYIIGLLHDVGKIAVPAEILSKPGKISQYEFNIIKNHSQIGYEILEKIEFPWPVSQAILQHHERLNGSGYPGGLSGNDIILEAQILGVADVVEAMSSHRPYRPALGFESALKEISEKSGILYTRDVVNACLKLLQNQQFAFEKLMSAANQENVNVEVGARK